MLSPLTSPPSTPSRSNNLNADEDVGQQESGLVIEGSIGRCATNGDSKKELLSDLVREERCIWDIKSPYYKGTGMKRTAWEKIKQLYGGGSTGTWYILHFDISII